MDDDTLTVLDSSAFRPGDSITISLSINRMPQVFIVRDVASRTTLVVRPMRWHWRLWAWICLGVRWVAWQAKRVRWWFADLGQ